MLKYDFIIVGAGIGGLYLGNYLEQQKKSYLIVETQSGVGGRVQTCFVDGFSFELGAARILSNHHKAMSLIESLGLETEEQHFSETPVYWENKWYESPDEIVDFSQYLNPISLFEEILAEYSIVDLQSFESLAPKEWDKILTRSWLEEKGVPFNIAKLFFLGDIDVNLEQITLYESLFFYLTNLIDKEGKIYRLKGGMYQIIEKLKSNLNILTDQKVVAVHQSNSGFTLHTTDFTLVSKYVIFTCSLSAISRIELPERAQKSLSDWLTVGHYGSSVKGYFRLKNNPFPQQDYLMSDIPLRMIRRSPDLWEFYLPSLRFDWDKLKIEQLLATYFGAANVEEFNIQNYSDSPFLGCYWNYTSGNFHRIFDAAQTYCLSDGIFSLGEHFSLNPNWIEGTLESVDNFLNNSGFLEISPNLCKSAYALKSVF